MRRPLLACLLALACLGSPVYAASDPAAAGAAPAEPGAGPAPSATDVLFDQPQMRNTQPARTRRYDYLRRSGIERGPYGPPIIDAIKLSVAPGQESDSRDIQVQMFSGGNRAAAGPFTNMAGNPVLPLFLENHLKGLASLLEANPRYLKNAIRKGLRENASVTSVTVPFQGRTVPAWRVVTKPFVNDPQVGRMRGFDTLTYTFVTSPEVPGEIVSIEAQARKPDGSELLEEKLDYDQNAG